MNTPHSSNQGRRIGRRLSQHTINEVNAKANFRKIFESLNIRFNYPTVQRNSGMGASLTQKQIPVGKHYYVLCPFHSEKTPSFHIDFHDNYATCFACTAGKGLVYVIANMLGINIHQAVNLVIKKSNITIKKKYENIYEEIVPNSEPGLDGDLLQTNVFYYDSYEGPEEIPDHLYELDFVRENDVSSEYSYGKVEPWYEKSIDNFRELYSRSLFEVLNGLNLAGKI